MNSETQFWKQVKLEKHIINSRLNEIKKLQKSGKPAIIVISDFSTPQQIHDEKLNPCFGPFNVSLWDSIPVHVTNPLSLPDEILNYDCRIKHTIRYLKLKVIQDLGMDTKRWQQGIITRRVKPKGYYSHSYYPTTTLPDVVQHTFSFAPGLEWHEDRLDFVTTNIPFEEIDARVHEIHSSHIKSEG